MFSNIHCNIRTCMVAGTVVALLLSAGCTKSPVSDPDETGGLKTVSINSSRTFTGDLSAFPNYKELAEAYQSCFSVDTGMPAGRRLEKAQAPIVFDEARALVLWYSFDEESMIAYEDYSALCENEMAQAAAFEGKNPVDFDDLVDGFSGYTLMQLLETSDLEKAGGYVEGQISVKPGLNNVLVCFIRSGKIIYASSGLYLYLSAFPGAEGYEDGWLPFYSSLEGEEVAWLTEEIVLYDASLSYPGYDFHYAYYPMIPFFGSVSSFMIGVTPEWVQEFSYYCTGM